MRVRALGNQGGILGLTGEARQHIIFERDRVAVCTPIG